MSSYLQQLQQKRWLALGQLERTKGFIRNLPNIYEEFRKDKPEEAIGVIIEVLQKRIDCLNARYVANRRSILKGRELTQSGCEDRIKKRGELSTWTSD